MGQWSGVSMHVWKPWSLRPLSNTAESTEQGLTQIQWGGKSRPSFPPLSTHVFRWQQKWPLSDVVWPTMRGLGSRKRDPTPTCVCVNVWAADAACEAVWRRAGVRTRWETVIMVRSCSVNTRSPSVLTLRQHVFAGARREVASPDRRYPRGPEPSAELSVELGGQGSHRGRQSHHVDRTNASASAAVRVLSRAVFCQLEFSELRQSCRLVDAEGSE